MAFDSVSLSETNDIKAECYSRSDCTYVKANLAVPFPQNEYTIENR